MNSSAYFGLVRHKRFIPCLHVFSTRSFYIYLDLDQIEKFFSKSWFWSYEKKNLASFYRKDYLSHIAGASLKEAALQVLKDHTQENFKGQIFLLGHMRYFGFCMNPLAVYYCYDNDGKLAYVINEVHNTPWNERYTYVLDVRQDSGPTYRTQFKKMFHVSPFLPMNLNYHWDFRRPGQKIVLAISDYSEATRVFEAQLTLKKVQKSLDRLILEYPFNTFKVILGIYWTALRLWLKGVQFISHP